MVAILFGVVVIWFAVANRKLVAVALYPLSPERELPVFAVAFAALIIGFAGGAAVAWLGGRKWRRLARARKREVAYLEREVARRGERPDAILKETGRQETGRKESGRQRPAGPTPSEARGAQGHG